MRCQSPHKINDEMILHAHRWHEECQYNELILGEVLSLEALELELPINISVRLQY